MHGQYIIRLAATNDLVYITLLHSKCCSSSLTSDMTVGLHNLYYEYPQAFAKLHTLTGSVSSSLNCQVTQSASVLIEHSRTTNLQTLSVELLTVCCWSEYLIDPLSRCDISNHEIACIK